MADTEPQLLVTVWVIVTEPVVTPVTIPTLLMEAIALLLLLQVPPETEPVINEVAPTHI